MYADPGVDALLFELEERRNRAAEERLARACGSTQGLPAGRLRRVLGAGLVRLGAVVGGEAGSLQPSAASEG